MKNILIVTNTRDNLGSAFSFVKELCQIKNEHIRNMVEHCILNKNYEHADLWASHGMCGSDQGYIFNEYPLGDIDLPLYVEHIVNYVF